jgi:hypothetical protein
MALKNALTASEVQDMVRHWLSCPPCGYLGSGYGSQVKELLQSAQSSGKADALIRKLREDVPILAAMPSDAVNLYAVTSGTDRTDIVLDVAGAGLVLTQGANNGA